MKWTKEPPTEPGWYWVKYNGYRTGAEITTLFELDRPTPGGMFSHLPLVRVERGGYKERYDCQIHFHPDCYPVFWAGPIEEPNE